MNDQHLVLTPEKSVVSFKVAGIGGRMMAQIIDVMILGGAITVTSIIFAILSIGSEALLGVYIFIISASFFVYFILFEWLWNGFTPGKKAMGIKVVSYDGTPVTLRGATYRNLMRPGDFLPFFYFTGFIACFLNEKSQRIGDLAAGTIVIYESKPNPHYMVTPHHAGEHPFENSVGQLTTMTMEEYFAIKKLADRFPELPPSIQHRSVEDIWLPFAKKEGIEPIPGVHPVYLMEAVVVRYGRMRKLF